MKHDANEMKCKCKLNNKLFIHSTKTNFQEIERENFESRRVYVKTVRSNDKMLEILFRIIHRRNWIKIKNEETKERNGEFRTENDEIGIKKSKKKTFDGKLLNRLVEDYQFETVDELNSNVFP